MPRAGELADRVEISTLQRGESTRSDMANALWDVLTKRTQAAYPGAELLPGMMVGGTDARFWRYRNVPAYVFGCSPGRMSTTDEYVTVDEYLLVVRTHILSAFDYLSRPTG